MTIKNILGVSELEFVFFIPRSYSVHDTVKLACFLRSTQLWSLTALGTNVPGELDGGLRRS